MATIFVDSYSDYTHINLQEDLSSDSTLDAKLVYKRRAHSFGIKVSGYHADNGRFTENAWKHSCEALQQSRSYGVAEQRK